MTAFGFQKFVDSRMMKPQSSSVNPAGFRSNSISMQEKRNQLAQAANVQFNFSEVAQITPYGTA